MFNPETKYIILTGPESTGKTTLMNHLSDFYGGICVQEYAREYINKLNLDYTSKDIELIAKKQIDELYENLQKTRNRPLFIDTYLIITKIWFNWFTGSSPDWVDAKIAETKDALYLLCSPDIEWIPDPVRENGGNSRKQLFNEYKRELEAFNLKYEVVTGFNNERINSAKKIVADYLYNK